MPAMCLILLARDVHPRYRLIVAANRDEYYDRSTAPLAWWQDHPEVLAGRDLRSGGTWMGITRDGRFAAVTNYREPGGNDPGARSRGRLVLGFLTSDADAPRHLASLRAEQDAYNGFSLVCGNAGGLCYCSNRSDRDPTAVVAGIHGVSNHLLNTPWPKVVRGKELLRAALDESENVLVDRLLALLRDRSVPGDSELPDTGVGTERERVLAPIRIVSPEYGTRSAHVLLFDRTGVVTFVEQSFDRGERRGGPVRVRFEVASGCARP